MSETLKREYYKIRFIGRDGLFGEWHRSNNGTDQWESLAKIKAILTRGIQCGYKGRISEPFENFEVVKFTEAVEITTEVVQP